MAERPVVFEGANLGLVVACVALALAAGLILMGPGNERLATTRETLRDHQKRIDTWQRQRQDARPVSPSEKQAWDEHYARLADFGAAAEDDTTLMAWVATRLSAPSVRDLQVSRAAQSEDEESDVSFLAARAPDGSASFEIHPVPLHVRFDARYPDVSLLLRRLEADLSPLRIQRLDLRRHYPGVRVELDVTLWTRREANS